MNSTIINKKKQLSCGHYDYNFSRSRCRQCSTIQGTEKRLKESGNAELEESRQNVMQDLVAVYSQYIRLKGASKDGMNNCYTCGKRLHWKQLQCGHYVARSEMATTFYEPNNHPQCPTCNSLHETNTEPYRKALNNDKIGLATHLEEMARTVTKITTTELKEMLIDYRGKVKMLKMGVKG